MLWRYVFRTVAGPTAAWLLFLCALFYLVAFMRGIDVLLGSAVGPLDVLGVFVLLTPQFLVQVAPVALLLGTLQGLGRLSADGELTAAQAVGLAPTTLLLAPVGLGLLLSATLGVLASTLQPLGIRAVRERVVQLIQRNAAADITPGQFYQGLAGLTVYVERVDAAGWHHVLVHDGRAPGRPVLTLAEHAAPIPRGQEQGLSFQLKRGTSHAVDGADGEVVTTFARGELNAALSDSRQKLSAFRFSREESTLDELYRVAVGDDAEAARSARLVLHERLRQVLAPLALALLAGVAGVGRRGGSRGRSGAIAVTLLVFLTYHLLARTTQSLGERGEWPALVASALPNVLAVALGLAGVAWLSRRGAA